MADTYDLPEGFTTAPTDPNAGNLVPGGGATLPEGFTLTPPLQPQTFGQSLKNAANMTGTMMADASGQLWGLPHTLGQLGDLGINKVGGWLGAQPDTSPGFVTRHTYSPEDISSGITNVASTLSQATGGQPVVRYQPKSDAERNTMQYGTTALAASVGNPSTAVARIGSGMGGDLGAKVAGDLVPGSAIAPFIGAMVGGTLAGIPSAAANRTLAGVPYIGGTPNEAVAANRRLGISDNLVGDASQSPTMQLLQNFALRMPGGGGVHDAMQEKLGQWGDALDRIAGTLAPARNPVQAGTALQGAVERRLAQGQAALRSAYNSLDMEMPGTTATPLTNYAQTLQQVRSQMPSMPATAETLQPQLSRQLLDSLITDAQRGQPDWRTVSGIRTRIGEMLADPPIAGDTSRTELQRIYGALSTDMQATVANQGPAAQTAFDRATALARNEHDFINNTASKLWAPRDQIKPEAALNAAFADDGTMLSRIRQEMPGAADELAGYKLRDASLATPGRQDATGTAVSPSTFRTDMAKLQPTAHDALFNSDPALAGRVADLRTSANQMAQTERLLNTSGTGGHLGTLAAVEGGMELIPRIADVAFDLQNKEKWAKLGSAALPLMAGPTASALATNPLLARFMSRVPLSEGLSAAGRKGAGVYYPTIGGLLGQ